MPTIIVFAYHSNHALLGDHNHLLFRIAGADYSVLYLRIFVIFHLFRDSCTASGAFLPENDPCKNGIILPLFEGLLYLV